MERLQKVLAHAGVASRRKCEELILAGRVLVNDEIVKELGTKVDPNTDIIVVDGKVIGKEEHVYLMLNKPKGYISAVKDPKGRRVVTDLIKGLPQRVYPVGRLDYDTEGLLLLTNDGAFANMLTHPKFHVPKMYHATLKGVPHGELLEQLRQGVKLEDGMTSPADVEYVDIAEDSSSSVIRITISEGRNRQVRRMFEKIGYKVEKLRRVKFGYLTLDGLPRGKFRQLTVAEVKELEDLSFRPS
jgi:23S rRNA pseudouridine2605 synthase